MRRSVAQAAVAAPIAFVRDNARWLAAGFLLALASSFGQTFFIAMFAGSLREEFGLSHGDWGLIYMVGTLASAATLIQLGRRADDVAPRRLTLALLVAFALVCVGMAAVWTVWLLPLLVFGLRLCGQGMLSHLSQTLTARWFVATRGRALAIASFGYPTGEALAPILAVALIAAIGWRATWGVAALMLVLVFLPVLWLLLSRDRTPAGTVVEIDDAAGLAGRHWTRGEAVRSAPFWLVVPALLAPGYILTVVFFLPAHIAETKGWALTDWAASYSIYAVMSVVASFAIGWAIDRFDARAMLPLYQLPLAGGLIVLSFGQSELAMFGAMVLFGLTAGASASTHAALLAELFGTRRLGEVKALGHAMMVSASAAGPGVTGVLLDLGVPFDTQCLWMAGYTLALSVLFLVAGGRLRDPADPVASPKS